MESDILTIFIGLFKEIAHLWVIVSILVTLTTVQMIKAVLKHYHEMYVPNPDPMTRKIVLFVIAMVIGYYSAKVFLKGTEIEMWKNYAYAIAFLNPLIYQAILITAQRRKWVRVVGLLKMRKVIEDKDGNPVLMSTLITDTDKIKDHGRD